MSQLPNLNIDRDESNNPTSPKWDNYFVLTFSTAIELYNWLKKDTGISDKIYEGTVYAYKNKIDILWVGTVLVRSSLDEDVEPEVAIDILVESKFLQTMIRRYTGVLLRLEQYEKLNTIKQEIESLGLEFQPPSLT